MTDRAAARRAAIRQHHPDVGGSAAALTEALDSIDRAYRRPAGDAPIIIVHRSFVGTARTLLRTTPVRIVRYVTALRRTTLRKARP